MRYFCLVLSCEFIVAVAPINYILASKVKVTIVDFAVIALSEF